MYSINFWWIDIFWGESKNIISAFKLLDSIMADTIYFAENFVYETGT